MSTRVPRVRVVKGGRVSNSLEALADAYRRANPEKDCRWVFDSLSKPELSNVTSRQAEGYRTVYPSQLGSIDFPLEQDKPVRVADVVLMGIDSSLKRELEMDRADAAAEAIRMIDRNFYKAIEEMRIPGAEERHRPVPMGRTSLELKTLEYDIEQRSGEEV